MSIFDFEESNKIGKNTTDQTFFFSDFCSVYSFGRKYDQRALLARFASTHILVASLSFQFYNRETASFIKIFIISTLNLFATNMSTCCFFTKSHDSLSNNK